MTLKQTQSPVSSILSRNFGFKKALLLGITVVALSSTATAGKLYKWVDADGNISYQDSPPPNNAKVLEESTIRNNGAPNATTANSSGGPTPVIVYTIENCNSCLRLLSTLQQLAVPYQEESLLSREIQSRILEQTDSLAAPTMFFNNKFVSGLSDEALKTELRAAGYEVKTESEASPTDDEDDGFFDLDNE